MQILSACMKRAGALKRFSWETCCNARMQRWAEQVGVFIKLEDYIDQIVFEQSVTNVAKINLTRRSVVSP